MFKYYSITVASRYFEVHVRLGAWCDSMKVAELDFISSIIMQQLSWQRNNITMLLLSITAVLLAMSTAEGKSY